MVEKKSNDSASGKKEHQSAENGVCALIVTYNRISYLLNLLEGLLQQTRQLDAILIFDNYSSDGTKEQLLNSGFCTDYSVGRINKTKKDNITIYYYRNPENCGGSGGFHKGLDLAAKLTFRYVWAMDDDVLPEPDCLNRLLRFQTDSTMICIPNRTGGGFQDYAIVDVDVRNPFIPSIDKWKKKILPEHIDGDTVFVKDMAFEGPLINTDIIKKIGLPNKDLFILFDDSEYAMRASKCTKLLFVKDAVLNKQIIPTGNVPAAKWKIYYNFRNAVWFNKMYGENWFVRNVRPIVLCLYWELKYAVMKNRECSAYVAMAYKDGVRGELGKTIDPQTFHTYIKKKVP